jgi:hypothetical protein
MSTANSTDPSWFVIGYRRALARFHETVDAREEPEERYIPLFETLNWAASLLDRNSPLHAKLDPDATVQGLRYVRNQMHHQMVEALEPRDVLFPRPIMSSGSGRGGGVFISGPIVLDWFWKPFDQLPPPTRGHEHRQAQAAYKAHLANQPARLALDHLDGLLPR